MAETEIAVLPQSTAVVSASSSEVANIRNTINIADRSSIAIFGDNAQQSVTGYADKILAGIRNKDLGDTGKMLTEIILKSKSLDASSLQKQGFFARMFSSAEAQLEKFRGQYEDVASQIDRIGLELDKNKDVLRRDIAILDNLHEETQQAIIRLDGYVQAGKEFGEWFRISELPKLKANADAVKDGPGGGLLEAQAYQDALQALDRLDKRVFYLQQARQIGIQQLPQIRIVQAGDETLIESLQATSTLTVPAWKQKMVVLLGLTRQKSALELQRTVTDATNDMIRQASEMMKDQAIAVEQQSQRGIVDIETLAQANRDLIDTIGNVLKVQEEGRTKRAAAEKQMEQMTVDLKNALTKG
jgi:uncharacterized protein YaaN involved in tellurite resistance